jgi:tetratricopeptide (TPR) repeat protein
MLRLTLGDEHPLVSKGMNNLAMWLMESDDYAAAEPLLRQALDLSRKSLGTEHVDVAARMTLLAVLLLESEQFEQARQLATDAKAIYMNALGTDHWRTASSAGTEGAALARLSQYEDAETLLLGSFLVLKNDPGALPFFVTHTTRWLMDLYQRLEKPEESVKYRNMLSGSH